MTNISAVAALAVQVGDFYACLAFYRLLLGSEIGSNHMESETGEARHTAWFALGEDCRLVLYDHGVRCLDRQSTAVGHLYCADPDALEQKLRANGVIPVTQTHDTAVKSRVFIVADPEGNELIVGTREMTPWTYSVEPPVH